MIERARIMEHFARLIRIIEVYIRIFCERLHTRMSWDYDVSQLTASPVTGFFTTCLSKFYGTVSC